MPALHSRGSASCPSCHPQFAGYSEEVLDVRFLGPEDSHVVVASNSPSLKVFELQTMACQILHGHSGEPAELMPRAVSWARPPSLTVSSLLFPRHRPGPGRVPEGVALCQLCQGNAPGEGGGVVPGRDPGPASALTPFVPRIRASVSGE